MPTHDTPKSIHTNTAGRVGVNGTYCAKSGIADISHRADVTLLGATRVAAAEKGTATTKYAYPNLRTESTNRR